MNKPIHPAVAEHVMEENARLREVLRCIADLPMDRCSTENDYRLSAAKAIALGALSQQGEPAPAQDEPSTLAAPFDLNEFARRAGQMMAEHDFHGFEPIALAIAEELLGAKAEPVPAQTEQQSIRLPERKRTEHLPKEYKTMTVVRAGLEAYNRALDDVAALNAAPIAQTAQQPEQTGLVEAASGALAAIQDALEDAYHNAYPECCGQAHLECCGSPLQAWSEADQKTMERFAPHEEALRAALSAQGASK